MSQDNNNIAPVESTEDKKINRLSSTEVTKAEVFTFDKRPSITSLSILSNSKTTNFALLLALYDRVKIDFIFLLTLPITCNAL